MLASFLPGETGPYLILMGIGFLVGGYGQLAKFRWLVIAGILIIMASALLFQLQLQSLPAPSPPPGL